MVGGFVDSNAAPPSVSGPSVPVARPGPATGRAIRSSEGPARHACRRQRSVVLSLSAFLIYSYG